MRSYGGSPFAYLCAFRATEVLQHIFNEPRLIGLVDLNSHSIACPISGYLPLHTAVANGRNEVYDLLEKNGASPQALTTPNSAPTVLGTVLELTPLQLACRLGHQSMLEHVLTRRWQTQWKWGPVISYKLPLEEIDSSGDSKWDLMELIALPDAVPATQKMLLDDFMGGFIFKLFEQKWERFAKRQHILFRMLDTVSLVLILTLGFSLKVAPLTCDRMLVPLVAIGCLILQTLYEVLKVGCNVRRQALPMSQWSLHLLIHPLAIVACLSVLVRAAEDPDEGGKGDEYSWALLSLAVFFEFLSLISVSFVPIVDMGNFALTVDRLLFGPVRIFLTFFFLCRRCHFSAVFLTPLESHASELTLIEPASTRGRCRRFDVLLEHIVHQLPACRHGLAAPCA